MWIDRAACPEVRGAGNTLMRHIGALADAISYRLRDPHTDAR
jgi:hypothetical protein